MSYQVSTATIDDLDHVAQLMNDYARQNLSLSSWPGSVTLFKRDYASGCFRVTVIRSDRKLVGFAAWLPSYDFHHCVHGAALSDLYIDPAYRCRGLGVALICAIADEITRIGWEFIRGQALSGQAAKLYERCAVRFGTNEYNLSGKALRQLAHLAGQSPREMIRNLPTRELNYEN